MHLVRRERLLTAVLSLALPLAACSSEVKRSNASKDAGADASADAGDSGTTLGCNKDADCDDGDPCNGTESCSPGTKTCESGTSPCAAASDPVNCVVNCSNDAGNAKCSSETAKDSDGDGHGTPLCAANPGDDCNDDDKNVYPGASETCDGIDSNCNGKLDIDDGLPLGGTIFDVAGSAGADAVRPQAAWSGDKLGVVWTDFTSGFHVFFSLFDANAKPLVSNFKVANIHYEATAADIAGNTSGFGVAFVGEIVGARHVFFRGFDANGAVTTGSVQLSTGAVDPDAQPRIVNDPSGGYLVVWKRFTTDFVPNGDALFGRKVDASGAAAGSDEQSMSTRAEPKIWEHDVAAFASEYALLQVDSAQNAGTGTQMQMIRIFAPLGVPTMGKISTTNTEHRTPVMLQLNGLHATAWSGNETLPMFAQLNLNGTFDCGPTPSNQPIDGGLLGGIISVGTTRAISFVSSPSATSGSVKLLRFDNKCKELPELNVAGAPITNPNTNNGIAYGARSDVALGDSKIAVVWDEEDGPYGKVRARIFGKNFCD